MTKKPVAALAVALFALSTAHPALARQTNRAHVSYSDLDLSTAPAQEELNRRLEAAVREVCRVEQPLFGYRTEHPSTRKCMANARTDAKLRMTEAIASSTRGGKALRYASAR